MISGRLFMMCNDLPPVTPADAMESMHMFTFPNQFVDDLGDNPLPFMKLKDDFIKPYATRRDVLDAYTWMVLDAYRKHKVKPSDGVRKETLLYRTEGGDEWAMMRKCFKITRDLNDVIHSSEIKEFLRDNGLNISAQKCRKRLEMMGARALDNVVIDGKRSRGFTGIVLIRSDE